MTDKELLEAILSEMKIMKNDTSDLKSDISDIKSKVETIDTKVDRNYHETAEFYASQKKHKVPAIFHRYLFYYY